MIATCWPRSCPDPGGLLRAALRLDDGGALDTVRPLIDEHGVLCTWERMIRPVWIVLGNDRALCGAERLFTRSMSQALGVVRRPWTATGPQVLLACSDEEHQALPVDVLAAALAEHGVSGCVLGARVPPRAVAVAAHRLRPKVVVVWSQTRDTADPAQVGSLSVDCPGPAVIAAGPGWRPAALPRRVAPAADVLATVKVTLALLGGPGAEPVGCPCPAVSPAGPARSLPPVAAGPRR